MLSIALTTNDGPMIALLAVLLAAAGVAALRWLRASPAKPREAATRDVARRAATAGTMTAASVAVVVVTGWIWPGAGAEALALCVLALAWHGAGLRRAAPVRGWLAAGGADVATMLPSAAFACALCAVAVSIPSAGEPAMRLASTCLLIAGGGAVIAVVRATAAAPNRRAAAGEDERRLAAVLTAAAAAVMLFAAQDLPAWMVALQPIIAGLGLEAALRDVLVERRHRRRAWLTDPRRLLERPAASPLLRRAVPASGWAVGILAAAQPAPGVSGVSLIIAAMGCGTLFHRRAIPRSGDLAMLLCAEALILSATEWTGSLLAGGVLGGTLVALAFALLAAFWRTQLDDGIAWTTAGRLLPAVRRTALAGAALAFGLALSAALGGAGIAGQQPLMIAAAMAGLAAAWALLQLADGDGPIELAAALATTGPVLWMWSGLEPGARSGLTPLGAAAGGASLLSLCLAAPLGRRAPGPVATGFVLGVVPVLTLLVAGQRGIDRVLLSIVVLALAAGLTLGMTRLAALQRAPRSYSDPAAT